MPFYGPSCSVGWWFPYNSFNHILCSPYIFLFQHAFSSLHMVRRTSISPSPSPSSFPLYFFPHSPCNSFCHLPFSHFHCLLTPFTAFLCIMDWTAPSWCNAFRCSALTNGKPYFPFEYGQERVFGVDSSRQFAASENSGK